MRILINEKLSEHKMKTPEGFLVCTDAILARTGKQEYMKKEVFDGCTDEDIISIDRKEQDVFSDKTIASFEDKAITWDHPSENVTPSNYSKLSVGHVRNVRRSTYNGEPVMVGDLVITDADAIEQILNGDHTELSCGYDCDIIQDADGYRQTNIRGNHVALCEQGRAGIAKIVDSKLEDAKITNEDELEFIKNASKIYKVNNHDKVFVVKTISYTDATGYASDDGGKTWYAAKTRVVKRADSTDTRHQNERRFSSSNRIEIPFSHISYCYYNHKQDIGNETIDHKDGDHMNDNPKNLEPVSNVENKRRDVEHRRQKSNDALIDKTHEVYKLCKANNWYTEGFKADYENLLENADNWSVEKIASDIASHSKQSFKEIYAKLKAVLHDSIDDNYYGTLPKERRYRYRGWVIVDVGYSSAPYSIEGTGIANEFKTLEEAKKYIRENLSDSIDDSNINDEKKVWINAKEWIESADTPLEAELIKKYFKTGWYNKSQYEIAKRNCINEADKRYKASKDRKDYDAWYSFTYYLDFDEFYEEDEYTKGRDSINVEKSIKQHDSFDAIQIMKVFKLAKNALKDKKITINDDDAFDKAIRKQLTKDGVSNKCAIHKYRNPTKYSNGRAYADVDTRLGFMSKTKEVPAELTKALSILKSKKQVYKDARTFDDNISTSGQNYVHSVYFTISFYLNDAGMPIEVKDPTKPDAPDKTKTRSRGPSVKAVAKEVWNHLVREGFSAKEVWDMIKKQDSDAWYKLVRSGHSKLFNSDEEVDEFCKKNKAQFFKQLKYWFDEEGENAFDPDELEEIGFYDE